MRIPRKILCCAVLLLLFLAASVLWVGGSNAYADVDAVSGDDVISVAFTQNMHSHLENAPSIKTIYDALGKSCPNLFRLDGGNFSAGTIYETVSQTQACELRMLGYLGVDAVCFGCNEFSRSPSYLSDMLSAAIDSGDKLPHILTDSVDFSESLTDKSVAPEVRRFSESVKRWGEAYEYDPNSYIILERGDYSIAVFSCFDSGVSEYGLPNTLQFYDPVEHCKTTVAEIKAKENADMIICISHGAAAISDNSENESKEAGKTDNAIEYRLAEECPDIDLLICANCESAIEKPLKSGNTFIVSCGGDALQLGLIQFKKSKSGILQFVNYSLYDSEEFISNSKAAAKLDEYKQLINAEYLSAYGLEFDQIIAYNPSTKLFLSENGENAELPLCNLITDSFVYALHEYEGDNYKNVDVAAVSASQICGNMFKGVVTTDSVFNLMPLGFGANGSPCYPLADIYLTGAELKNLAEADASLYNASDVASLYFSGLRYTASHKRMILNRVMDVEVKNAESGEYEPVENEKLYRIVCDLYTCAHLSDISRLSHGMVKLAPKDADGNEISDFSTRIIRTENGELKPWYAVARYIMSFPTAAQNIAQIPKEYDDIDDRKIINDEIGFADILKAPSTLGKIVISAACAIILILLVSAVLIIRAILKRRKPKVVYINNLWHK